MAENNGSSPAYRSLWVWLLLVWAASAADRAIAGPVFSYIISNDLPIIQGVENPYKRANWAFFAQFYGLARPLVATCPCPPIVATAFSAGRRPSGLHHLRHEAYLADTRRGTRAVRCGERPPGR